jgi:tetratricopeptide (TPR) repeat protein
MKQIIYVPFILVLFVTTNSCKKGWLEKKSDIALVVPETLDDLQALLDADRYLNGSGVSGDSGPVPGLGEAATDDYYFLFDDWQSRPDFKQKQAYIWAPEIFNGTVGDWNNPYRSVFYANNVLTGLEKIEKTDKNISQWNNVKGGALFFRAHAFYHLAQVFAEHYNKNTATQNYGIPLKLSADINETSARPSVQETYDRIISDLNEAYPLLTSDISIKTRPSRPAAFAMLARVYLVMEDYEKAKIYADSCLNLYSSLMNFNDPLWVNSSPSANTSFKRFNPEVIFHAMAQNSYYYHSSRSKVDSNLYASYDVNDLRKATFWRTANPGFRFKGSYDGSTQMFAGIATDEVFLIRAECFARLGDLNDAMMDLNNLLRTRWKIINGTSTFADFTANDVTDALNIILIERRKELTFRSLRWTDLRRLNKQGANISLTRDLNGQIYTLPPNDDRWIFPIPPDVISTNPSMPQNPR